MKLQLPSLFCRQQVTVKSGDDDVHLQSCGALAAEP